MLLAEANDLATGTSGATQAWVWVHSKTPRYYMELNWRGARLHLRTVVKALDPDDAGDGGGRGGGTGWLIRTNRGDLRCRTLVIAAGFYTPSVARLAGVEVPVQPVRG